MRTPFVLAGLLAALSVPAASPAQHLDLTLFGGAAFPVLDGQLVLRAPGTPTVPGVEITASGTPELRTDGGLVFGAALALEFGILALEGRLDSTAVGFDVTGARYGLLVTEPPLQGLTGSVTVGDGRMDLRRLNIVSVNLRLRTPGPIALIASGGVSYLPDIEVEGSVPLEVEIGGQPVLPTVDPRITLVATPDQSSDRWGLNAGAGIRIGAGRLAFLGEARFFYFGDYQLRFAAVDPLPFLPELAESISTFRFEPVFLNAQAGIVIRF
jgi:hypothetical protein